MAQPLSNPTEECTARSTDFFKQGVAVSNKFQGEWEAATAAGGSSASPSLGGRAIFSCSELAPAPSTSSNQTSTRSAADEACPAIHPTTTGWD